MTFVPTAGPVALFKVAPSPAGTPATAPGINWKLTIDGKLVDISNFQVGRYPNPTLEDADLSFTLVWDGSNQPFDPAKSGIDAGLDILGKLYTDASHFYIGTFTVSTVEPGVDGLENVVMYPVTAKLKGVLTRPTP